MATLSPPQAGGLESVARSLRRLPYFSGLRSDELHALSAKCRLKYADAGEVLIDETWDAAPGLYIITAGEARVERRAGHDRVILANLSKGDLVGELSLFDGLPPSATVVAATDLDAILLPRCEFIVYLERSPALANAVIAVLAGRLRESNESRVSRQTKDARARLAEEIVRIAARQAPDDPNPVVRLELSQTAMGHQLGISRESVNKLLKSLQEGNVPALIPFGRRRGAFRLNLESLNRAAR